MGTKLRRHIVRPIVGLTRAIEHFATIMDLHVSVNFVKWTEQMNTAMNVKG